MITDANQAFIINEAAVRELQLINPLETRFEWGGPEYGKTKKGKVIGVVKDFQFQSLKSEINPLIIHIHPSSAQVFAIKTRSNDISDTLTFIKDMWEKLDPVHPFEYSFMNETFDSLYNNEEKLSQIFTVFSALAILIAILGLFGLTLFIVAQKTKEIGIRKVLGASIGNIFILVTGEFARLIIFANIIAWPVAYFLMHNWLKDFTYRISLGIWIFLVSAVLVFIITLLIVSVQVFRAAQSNPVESLKYE
jgi:putative ABC transport system permease protein